MSNKQLTITASILAKTEKREFVKQALLKLIPPTLKEEGCTRTMKTLIVFSSMKIGAVMIIGNNITTVHI